MPTYEYKCTECEELFEFFQKMSDKPIEKCPVCGGRLRRIVSGGIGVIFKGSGFYTTDYKSSSSSNLKSGKPEEKAEEKSAKTSDSVENKEKTDSVQSK